MKGFKLMEIYNGVYFISFQDILETSVHLVLGFLMLGMIRKSKRTTQ